MELHLSKAVVSDFKELFLGPKRIGGQYVLPIEFTRECYLDEPVRRSFIGSLVAILDLFVSFIMRNGLNIIKFFLIRLRSSIWYVLYNHEDRRKITEVTFFDWNGGVINGGTRFRNRVSLLNVKLDVSKDNMKTAMVKFS